MKIIKTKLNGSTINVLWCGQSFIFHEELAGYIGHAETGDWIEYTLYAGSDRTIDRDKIISMMKRVIKKTYKNPDSLKFNDTGEHVEQRICIFLYSNQQ